MIPAINTAYIISQLGNNSSLLPMALKDVAHSTGMTTASYITGDKIEGKDRLLDEAGAAAIWLGGLPVFKFLIDKTIYKVAKQDPNIDIRLLKDKKILAKAIENAPTKEIKQSIEKAVKNEKAFKGLFLAKFIAATAMTLGSYGAFTIFRHKHTEKNIIKEIKKEQELKFAQHAENKEKAPQSFQAVLGNNKKGQKPSFGMNLSALKTFMFDPVKNMMIVDGGITAERLGESRNPQDLMGYIIKEGSFWAFMYFAGPKIQQFFEKIAEKKHNKSIELDMRVLQDSTFQNSIKTKEITKSIEEVNSIIKLEKVEKFNKKGEKEIIEKILNPEEVYDFVCKNNDNLVVKMAKKSGIVSTVKNTDKVDTQKYIDIDEIKGVKDKIQKLIKQLDSSGESAEVFIKKLVSLKRGSVLKNIVSCMGVLGLVVPGLMLLARYSNKDNKEFQVKKQIQEKLNQNMMA